MNPEAAQLDLQIRRYLEMGRLVDARRLTGRFLALTPEDPEALLLAARVAVAQEQNEEGRARLADVLARAPGHREARLLLYEVELDADHFAEAEALVLALLRETPDHAALIASYARLMLRVYQLDKARALVNEALRRSPELPLAQTLDALLHIIHGDDASAGERLGRLMLQDPEAEHVAWTAMAVLETQNRPREAMEIGRQLLRTQPQNQALIAAIVALGVQAHWTMKPLWPVQRFGWGGSIGLWVVGVIGLKLLAGVVPDMVLGALAIIYFLYIVYSWVWPPLLRRWLMRRGF